MRNTVSSAFACLFLILAAGSAEESPSAVVAVDPMLGTEPPVATPEAAAPAGGALEASLDAVVPKVEPGFVFHSEVPGADLPTAVRTTVMGMDAETEGVVGLQGLGAISTASGPVYLVRTMLPAGAGIFSFHHLRRGPGGTLVKTDLGASSVEACGTHESFRGTVEPGGAVLLETARWTEICGDGGEDNRTESVERVHPDGRREGVAG